MVGGYHTGTEQMEGKDELINRSLHSVSKAPQGCPRMLWEINLTPRVGCVGGKIMVREGFLEEAAPEQTWPEASREGHVQKVEQVA